jgi:biotin-dependent carboxylase-like uncharacterized protein
MTGGRDAFEVLASGPMLLVEDRGRPGFAHLGVPPSGALDPVSLALANRLVGNAEDAAGLEILLGGVRLRALRSARIALTGAAMSLTVGGRHRPWGEAISVKPGDEVVLGPANQGLRGWLAVSGGIVAGMALGSASTDTLTGLGPAPLKVGNRIETGRQPDRAGDATAVQENDGRARGRITVWLGPRDDWFTAEALRRFASQTYVVSPNSNRTAVRLGSESGRPLTRRRASELPSEGLVTGAIQVPSGGEPLVFLADHPVTGGYPVIGVVDVADLARCAQLRPGDRVSFTVADRPGRADRRPPPDPRARPG